MVYVISGPEYENEEQFEEAVLAGKLTVSRVAMNKSLVIGYNAWLTSDRPQRSLDASIAWANARKAGREAPGGSGRNKV